MKKHGIFAAILITAMSFASCSDDLDSSTGNTQSGQFQDTVGNVVIQQRDPNLPNVKSINNNKIQTREDISGEFGNSDALLGCGYNYKNGSLILGDFSNVRQPIIDLMAIKEYDRFLTSGRRLNTSETTSFAYDTYDRYQHNSRVSKQVSTGFSINFKIFSFGSKKKTTEIFSKMVDNMSASTFGELDVNFINNLFILQNAEANRKLFARQFLTRGFINSLFNSPISSTLETYGEFVLIGYLTGGRAHASYAGTATENLGSDSKEKIMEKSMSASVALKTPGDTVKASFGFTGRDYDSTATVFKSKNTYINIKTYGGKRTGDEAQTTVRAIKDLNINLTEWMRSLNDVSTNTMIDIADNGLCPLSGFVLEKNFKQGIEDTFNEVLPIYKNLVDPYVEILRVMNRSTPSYEALYDVAAVLTTRHGDKIVLSDGVASSATDAELRKNEDNTVFMQKVEKIAAEKSKLFSSGIEISYNKKTRLNPNLRSPLCIELPGFKEKNFYRFYYEKTSIEYIYDPATRLCFSYYMDDGDDGVLDIYGIRDWVESLHRKNISIATLANSYKIIGL